LSFTWESRDVAASTQDGGLRWAVIVTHRRPCGVDVIGSPSKPMGAPSAPPSRVLDDPHRAEPEPVPSVGQRREIGATVGAARSAGSRGRQPHRGRPRMWSLAGVPDPHVRSGSSSWVWRRCAPPRANPMTNRSVARDSCWQGPRDHDDGLGEPLTAGIGVPGWRVWSA